MGLATGLKVLERAPRLSVVVLEKEDRVAAHQTGHNSGVIHSGLYYKPGSEKARTCVEGRRLLVEFCEKHGVPHEICGKLVVATSESELAALADLERRLDTASVLALCTDRVMADKATTGTAMGVAISNLIIPLLQVGNQVAARIPPFLVRIDWLSVFQIYILFGILFVVALIVLFVMLVRMKIFQAVKLGEAV